MVIDATEESLKQIRHERVYSCMHNYISTTILSKIRLFNAFLSYSSHQISLLPRLATYVNRLETILNIDFSPYPQLINIPFKYFLEMPPISPATNMVQAFGILL